MTRTIKICKCCDTAKLLDDFPKMSRNKDGLHSNCKQCINLINKLYRVKNRDKVLNARRKYVKKNKDQINRKRKENKSAKQIVSKRNYDAKYRAENRSKIKQNKREWEYKNRNNPVFKIKRNLRRRIHHALNGANKSNNTIELLGCSVDEFKIHLESQFQDGMTWENYGRSGWHIDHIKPCHTFDLTNPQHQKECFHYTNQRPLWAKDNLSRQRFNTN